MPYDVLDADVPRGVGIARVNLSKFNFFYQFFTSRNSFSREYVLEACSRSENYEKTSIRDRGAYLLCLLSGRRNISEAIELLGCSDEEKKAVLVIDDGHHDELRLTGISFTPFLGIEDDPAIYGSMALVEMEMVH